MNFAELGQIAADEVQSTHDQQMLDDDSQRIPKRRSARLLDLF